MDCTKEGYQGTRVDIMSDMADRLLNRSRDYGIGRLKLNSAAGFAAITIATAGNLSTAVMSSTP